MTTRTLAGLCAGFFMRIVLTACETVTGVVDRAAESDTAVRAGTAEYIDLDADRAQRVIDWTEDAAEALDAADEVKLARLQQEADARIPWDRLSPGQRILAEELLTTVEARIADEIDAGVLEANAVASIHDVLDVIRGQAERELVRAQ